MSETYAIRATNLGKRYTLGEMTSITRKLGRLFVPAITIKERETRPKPSAAESFWALRDISFDLQPGENLGVIGENGAGKSTLLKILSRITAPTTGRAVLHGRVGSLLEVGTGFNPELTGRENIYLNGAILGMNRREIQRHYDEIVAFSEVEKFLDTPVKRYSSGMRVRLGFAVAAHLRTEILVVDEVLAVGDQTFRNRCLGKMNEVARQGKTVIFVSHNLQAINNLCSRCILLKKGRMVADDKPTAVVARYLAESSDIQSDMQTRFPVDPNKSQQVVAAGLFFEDGTPVNRALNTNEPLLLRATFRHEKPTNPSQYATFSISDMNLNIIYFSDSRDTPENVQPVFTDEDASTKGGFPLESRYGVRIDPPFLAPGKYLLSVGIARPGKSLDEKKNFASFEIVDLDGHRPSRPGYFYRSLAWERISYETDRNAESS